jgi:hypothetical protein
MSVTQEELQAFLKGRDITEELRPRIRKEWENPDSPLRQITRREQEFAERLYTSDFSAMPGIAAWLERNGLPDIAAATPPSCA